MLGGVEIDLVIACYNGVMLTSLGRKARAWFDGEVALLIMATQAAPEPQAGESFKYRLPANGKFRLRAHEENGPGRSSNGSWRQILMVHY